MFFLLKKIPALQQVKENFLKLSQSAANKKTSLKWKLKLRQKNTQK
jgi:hypothetical protein